MAARTAVVNVELVSVEGGLWCDICASSRGVRAWFTVTVNGGETRLQSHTTCESHQ